MKILLITYNLGGTASGVVTERLANEMLKQGIDLKIITSFNKSKINEDKIIEVRDFIREDTLIKNLQLKIYQLLFHGYYDCNYIWRYRSILVAKKLIQSWEPDLIYSRSTPFDSFDVGIKLRKLIGKPLLIHYTDPRPAPLEYVPAGDRRDAHRESSKYYLSSADFISMGTNEAISYMEMEIGITLKNRVFVSPDSVAFPDLQFLEKSTTKEIHLVYLGDIYGSRNVHPLLDAISELRLKEFEIVLDVYTNRVTEIYPDFVKIKGRTNNVKKALGDADILVDIDGNDQYPVFVSSKLKEYIVVNRPIISITPANSPSANICKNLETISCVRNESKELANCIRHMISCSDGFDYTERHELIRRFSVNTILRDILYNTIKSLNYNE